MLGQLSDVSRDCGPCIFGLVGWHLSTMISFASFPAVGQVGGYNQPYHPYDAPDDVEMDLDGDYLDADGSKLTCPGESLTSSQAFMR